MIIREAELSDARQLARLAERTFRATFAAVNTAEDMEAHCRSSYGEAIQAAEITDPKRMTLLCEMEGDLVGFAQLRWGRGPACVVSAAAGEIQRLYVADAWHGRGIAQALMNACIDEVRRRGADLVWLGVWEHNPRAIAFYTKFGFVKVGEQVFQLGSDAQRDLVMARPIQLNEPEHLTGSTAA